MSIAVAVAVAVAVAAWAWAWEDEYGSISRGRYVIWEDAMRAAVRVQVLHLWRRDFVRGFDHAWILIGQHVISISSVERR